MANADHRNIIIKNAEKGSCTVIQGRNDYLMKVEKQLIYKKVYQEVSNGENILSKSPGMSSKMFSSLEKRAILQKNDLNIFPMNTEKPQTFINFSSFRKFIKGSIMSQDNQ